MINKISVGDKFTYGYTPTIVGVTVTSIEVVKSTATSCVTALVRYDCYGNPGCMDGEEFMQFLDQADARRVEEE